MLTRNQHRLADMLREVNGLRSHFNRVFGEWPTDAPRAYPPINMWGDAEKLVFTAELPGMKAEDLTIEVKGDVLTLGGRSAQEDQKAEYYRRERPRGGFNRAIALPYEVDGDKVEAKLERGVLTVTLPRAEADKPRRITVKGS